LKTVPISTFFTSTPVALNVCILFLTTHSAALWLIPTQNKYVPSVTRVADSFGQILHFAIQWSMGAGPVQPAIIPVEALVGLFDCVGHLGQEAKAVPLHIF